MNHFNSERKFRFLVGIFILQAFYLVPWVSGACEDPWFQLDDSCYYMSPNGNSETVSSWHQAQSWCLQNGGDLATINDIDERRLITNETQVGIYNGAMWIGLNRLEDRINYKWTDGSTSEFRDWAVGEPSTGSNSMCAFQLTHPKQDCFTHDPGISTIDGLFTNPHDENRPHTFYFAYLAGLEDNEGSAECQSRCSVEPPCYSYTFVSKHIPGNVTWMGECMGRSNEYNVSVPSEYVISGVRYNCGESGYWYEGNCGEKRGFICKKFSNSSPGSPPTKLPTPTVPGFCPAGYIDGGGNKCFKMVPKGYEDAVTWDTAVQLCRAEPGIAPDLASIQSEYENALITMYIRYEYWGFWIGLRQSDSFPDQWLWTDNQDVSYFNWASTKPSGTAKCTELWTDPGPAGTWNNLDCLQGRSYICQSYKDSNSIILTPPTTPVHLCKADYYNYGGICYRKITTGSSWSAALATCEADGATLATVHNEGENSALYVFARDIAPFWIGYHKDGSNEWVWTDGWPDIYSNWNAGEDAGTGGGCASFKDTGKWKDDDCTSNLAAICMISTATVPTTPAPVEGVCPTNWTDFGSYCYYFSGAFETQNWDMATVVCDTKASYYTTGNLVSIHSPAENQFIYESLKSRGVGNAWIGLYKEAQGSPHKWSDGTEMQYNRWAPGEPNDRNGSQQCIELYVTMWPGMWNDHLCNAYMPFVCKGLKVAQPSTPPIPPSGSCHSGWRAFGEYCYYMDIVSRLSFNQAQETCVRMVGRHAKLAIIHDPYTNLFLMQLVAEVQTYRVQLWIGLTRPHKDAEFRWLDKTTLNFTNWAPGEPNDMGNEHCGELHSDIGVWNDMNCETNRLAFICQIKPEHLPPPTASPTEANPPSSDSGIYLTSGELAGIIIGTMIAMTLITGVSMFLYGSYRGGFSSSKKPDGTDTASTYDLPYNNYDEQPYGTLSRSSSVKSSTYTGSQSQTDT